MDSTPADSPYLGRLRQRVMSEAESLDRAIQDFADPSQEWRRLFSELLGTFLLVLVAAGGGMMGQAFPHTISRTAAVVAPALMVLGVILFMGKVSGAHLNPAVSVAFSLRGDSFRGGRVPGYVVAQLAGACLAAWFLQATVHVSSSYGSNYPAAGFSAGNAFVMETALTFGLVSVILGTASGAQNLGVIGALGVRGYIALAGLWGSPISRSLDESRANVRAQTPSAPTSTRTGCMSRGSLLRSRHRGRCRFRSARPRRRAFWIQRSPGWPVHRGGSAGTNLSTPWWCTRKALPGSEPQKYLTEWLGQNRSADAVRHDHTVYRPKISTAMQNVGETHEMSVMVRRLPVSLGDSPGDLVQCVARIHDCRCEMCRCC